MAVNCWLLQIQEMVPYSVIFLKLLLHYITINYYTLFTFAMFLCYLFEQKEIHPNNNKSSPKTQIRGTRVLSMHECTLLKTIPHSCELSLVVEIILLGKSNFVGFYDYVLVKSRRRGCMRFIARGRSPSLNKTHGKVTKITLFRQSFLELFYIVLHW